MSQTSLHYPTPAFNPINKINNIEQKRLILTGNINPSNIEPAYMTKNIQNYDNSAYFNNNNKEQQSYHPNYVTEKCYYPNNITKDMKNTQYLGYPHQKNVECNQMYPSDQNVLKRQPERICNGVDQYGYNLQSEYWVQHEQNSVSNTACYRVGPHSDSLMYNSQIPEQKVEQRRQENYVVDNGARKDYYDKYDEYDTPTSAYYANNEEYDRNYYIYNNRAYGDYGSGNANYEERLNHPM